MQTIEAWPVGSETWPTVRWARFGGQTNERSRTKYQHYGESDCGGGRDFGDACVGAQNFCNSGVFAEVPDVVHHLPQQLPGIERFWRGIQEERVQVSEGRRDLRKLEPVLLERS